ncbi:MAG: hypothetical protein ACOYJ2_01000 [Rickettsiales bacterium]
MTEDEREERRRKIEELEGEEGVEVRGDSTAAQIASLLAQSGYDFNDDPAYADSAHLGEGLGTGDPAMARYAANRLAAHTARAQATARSEVASTYLDTVLFDTSGALKKGTFLTDEDGHIRGGWQDKLGGTEADIRSAIATLTQNDEAFQRTLIRAGDALKRGDRGPAD